MTIVVTIQLYTYLQTLNSTASMILLEVRQCLDNNQHIMKQHVSHVYKYDHFTVLCLSMLIDGECVNLPNAFLVKANLLHASSLGAHAIYCSCKMAQAHFAASHCMCGVGSETLLIPTA